MSTEASSNPAHDALGFDPDALRERYQRERDKRLRKDGNDQFQAITGDLGHFIDDPYVEPGFERESIEEELNVVVMGGGFSGLCTSGRLREAGVEKVRVIETGGDFGGTWYWNRYPGAQCDIESYIYLPMLEELGTMPTLKYSFGPEIFAHAQAIGRHFDLYRNALFQTQVTGLHWNADRKRWLVTTSRGDRLHARFVAVANGPLSRPKLPGIPGVGTFEGHSFHTSRWDYRYTGGDSTGNLSKLGDKRVGIIGTGATAVQCVPHLGHAAEHLYVFQRTPSSIDERRNSPTDPTWVESLEPGWQQERIDNFSTLLSGGLAEEDMVSDGWTDIIRNLSGMAAKVGDVGSSPEDMARLVELADFEKMEQIRARVDSTVSDPKTAETLKPWYRQFCKRPCFHDEYLPTFERPNVTLVDTQGQGVDEITKRGVVIAGEEYELDCLIYSTGFEVGTDYSRRAACEIVGRDGLSLSEKWKGGITTHHGLMTDGFPNIFLMGGIQSGVTPNFTELYNEQSKHLAYIIGESLEAGHTQVEPTPQAVSEWVRTIQAATFGTEDFAASCTPGYYNNEGQPDVGPGWFGGTFADGAPAFFKVLRDWREKGDFAGLDRS